MNEEYYLKSLKRLYDEMDKIQRRKDYQSVNGVLKTYNELLPDLKENFSENEVIQSREKAEFRVSRRGTPHENIREMQKTKMDVLRMADSLGVQVEDFERRASSEGMHVIHVNQSVSQSVEISIEGVMQIVNNLPREDAEKEELQNIIEKYRDELNKDDPDKSALLDLISNAREYSKDVAVKLAMVGLQRGIDLVA